jgi:hypothetical protein
MKLMLAIGIAVLFLVLPAVAAPDVPAYPAAQQKPLPPGFHSATTQCGHTITVERSYTVDADPRTIAKWYESRVPGSRAIDLTRLENGGSDASDNAMTSFEVISADGSRTIVINRMNYSAALKNASKSIGLDKAQIGVEAISPPFGAGYGALVAQAAAGGASAQKAKAQIMASCKS